MFWGIFVFCRKQWNVYIWFLLCSVSLRTARFMCTVFVELAQQSALNWSSTRQTWMCLVRCSDVKLKRLSNAFVVLHGFDNWDLSDLSTIPQSGIGNTTWNQIVKNGLIPTWIFFMCMQDIWILNKPWLINVTIKVFHTTWSN